MKINAAWIAALAAGVLAFAAAPAATREGAPKGLFHPSRLQTAEGGYTKPTQFSPARVCAGCHAEIFYQWDGSMHSRAHPDPLYLGLSGAASRETNGLTDRFCAGCHSPVGVASGEVPPVGNPLMSLTGAEGVSCDFCHTIDRATGIGNLPAVLDPGPDKRGPRRDAPSPFHNSVFLDLSAQAEFCGLCHDVSHPLNNLPIERTYTEWKEGPYNAAEPGRRVYCQDCHMRQSPGQPSTGMTRRPDIRAKAASMGPTRDHVYTHYFVGGNAAQTGLFGAQVHQAMAVERLRAAATLEIRDAALEGDELKWSVRVVNAGAGHFLPTGLTEVRQMWVETKVVAPDGTVLFASGTLDDKGRVDPKAVLFHTVLGDAEGKPTAKVWEAARVLSDRRIPPGGHDDLSFSAALNGRPKGSLTVTARLLYRSYAPELAVLAAGPGAPPAPVVEMTSSALDVGAGK